MRLDKENYLIFAAQNYHNVNCTSIADFNKDVKIFITARTLLRTYHKNGRLKIRLLLNHIITCTNIFSPRATVRLFFYHCEDDLWPYLKTIFEFMNIIPDYIPETDVSKIEFDPTIQNMLEDL